MTHKNCLVLGITFLTLLCFTSFHGNVSQELDSEDLNEYQSFEILKYLLATGHIQKCLCSAEEAYIENDDGDNTCVPHEALIPILLDPGNVVPEPVYANISLYGKVDISQPQCSNGSSLTAIHVRDIFFLIDGSMLHVPTGLHVPPSDFCIEHTTDYSGNISYEVRTCLSHSQISVCCTEPHSNNSLHCMDPKPSIWAGYSYLKDPTMEVTLIDRMQCKESELESSVHLTAPGDSAYLFIDLHTQETSMVMYLSHDQAPKLLNQKEYCIYPDDSSDFEEPEFASYVANFCTENPLKNCENQTCVMKCCPVGMLMNIEMQQCLPIYFATNESLIWKPSFKTENRTDMELDPSEYKMIPSFPICSRGYYLINQDMTSIKEQFSMLENGELLVPGISTPEVPPRYCVDYFSSNTGDISENAFVCFPDPKKLSTCNNAKPVIISVLLSVSCVFLAITLIVYASIKELHAKLHGKSLLSHVASLLTAYIFLTINTSSSRMLTMITCRIFAFIVQISFLGAFFWLNVMCFDIWWTLRAMRPVGENSESYQRKFFYYSIYAWGCPLAIGIATVVMETLPDIPEYKFLIRPGFGLRNCWFSDNRAMWLYFYSYVSIISVANLCFFVAVALILIQAQRANSKILKNTHTQHKERIWIYLKLFVVMGITWICEVASWQQGTCDYWIFTDILNCLQGFFIFLIFICKRAVWAKIKNRRGRHQARPVAGRKGHGSSYYGSSQVSAQTSLDSSTTSFRRLSTTIQYHLSRLQTRDRVDHTIPEDSVAKNHKTRKESNVDSPSISQKLRSSPSL